MRLINADTLIKWLQDTYCDARKDSWDYDYHIMAMEIMDEIDRLENYPTAEERKHGHWYTNFSFEKYKRSECSLCGYATFNDSSYWNYCPMCGAIMDGEV